jgi:hypothetical protein
MVRLGVHLRHKLGAVLISHQSSSSQSFRDRSKLSRAKRKEDKLKRRERQSESSEKDSAVLH